MHDVEVSRRGDVEAVLTSPVVLMGPVPDTGGAARALQVQMARFTDGRVHDHARAAVVSLLSRVDEHDVRRDARALSLERLPAQAGPVEVMALLARHVPVAVLTVRFGLDPDVVVQLVARLCAALAPTLDEPPPPADGDAAATELVRLLGTDAEALAVLSVLFQAHDATAALIAAALLAGAGQGVEESIQTALREAPPVRSTRRVADADLTLGNVPVQRGDRLVVGLHAAPFGLGPHACPGRQLALALAEGVVDALCDRQFQLTTELVEHEPRPNLTLPVLLEGEVS